MVYTDNRNIIGVYVCLDNLHLQKDLSNNFISYLKSNCLMHLHPSLKWT